MYECDFITCKQRQYRKVYEKINFCITSKHATKTFQFEWGLGRKINEKAAKPNKCLKQCAIYCEPNLMCATFRITCQCLACIREFSLLSPSLSRSCLFICLMRCIWCVKFSNLLKHEHVLEKA